MKSYLWQMSTQKPEHDVYISFIPDSPQLEVYQDVFLQMNG